MIRTASASTSNAPWRSIDAKRQQAFTLVELLVVNYRNIPIALDREHGFPLQHFMCRVQQK